MSAITVIARGDEVDRSFAFRSHCYCNLISLSTYCVGTSCVEQQMHEDTSLALLCPCPNRYGLLERSLLASLALELLKRPATGASNSSLSCRFQGQSFLAEMYTPWPLCLALE